MRLFDKRYAKRQVDDLGFTDCSGNHYATDPLL